MPQLILPLIPRDYDDWFKNGIPNGEKHHGLFKFACKKISQGLTYDEVLILTTEVARRCDPLPEDGPEHAAKVRVEEASQKYGKENSEADDREWEEPIDLTRQIQQRQNSH